MSFPMSRLWAYVVLLTLVSAKLAVGQGEWPQFRGPDGQGNAPHAQPPTTWSESENIRWKTAIHGRGWSSPVIWENQIWLTTATENGLEMYAVCVDRETGEIIHDRHLFHNNKPDEIHATNSYASPTPVIEGDRVYVHFGSYGTACLDRATCDVIWERRDLPCNHWRGPGSSPIIFENLLIVHYDGYDYQYIAALNKHTGETVWKKDREITFVSNDGDLRKAFSTPLVIEAAGKTQLISTCANGALSYDPRSGDVFWKVHFENHSATAMPLFDGNLLYINTGFSKADLWAVRPDGAGDVTDTHVVWKRSKSIGSQPSAVLLDGLIYVVQDAGVASCVDAATGDEVWLKRLGGNYSSSVLNAGGHLYISSQEGDTLVLNPGRKYDEVAKNKLDDGCMASHAAVGKALYLRTKSHLYRIEAPE